MAAYGGPRYQLTQQVMNRFAEAVEKSGIELVPRVLVGGGGSNGEIPNAMHALMTMLLSERMGIDPSGSEPSTREASNHTAAPSNGLTTETA